MRLKKLLYEDQKESLDEKLEEFKSDNKTLLYRQTDTVIDGKFEVRSIREKMRMPLGASVFPQVFIDFLIDKNNMDVPKRSQSKYAMTEKPGKYIFGDHTYVVFPQKNSNIVSFEKDTVDYRVEVDRAFDRINFHYQDDIDQYHYFNKLLEKATNINIEDEKTVEEFRSFVEDKWKYVIQDRQNIYRDESFPKELKENVRKMFESFHKYFDNMKKGVVGGSEEIIFDGDKYLAVDMDYFEKNVRWNGFRWTTKNEKT